MDGGRRDSPTPEAGLVAVAIPDKVCGEERFVEIVGKIPANVEVSMEGISIASC